MRTYATTEDLTTFLAGKPVPADAEGLLRVGSMLVARETRTAYYSVDAAGYPLRTDTREAFRDAVTAQAAFWAANNLDPTAGALKEVSSNHTISKSIKGASIGKSVTLVENSNRERSLALNRLCEEARTILEMAGLLNNPPAGY
ncbi:hypothetical protein [Arthrobacter sp. N1]|uniref:hypothetical protein n=1 Tax=Arthrobacter sp. N1 TaxID=619291 RepID=UPI003BB0B983